jgi:ribosomal protein S18 acetylase RimI-like enzyme
MVTSEEDKVVQVQEAKDSNIDDLIRLENKCFTAYYKQHRFSEGEFADYLSKKQAILLVATLESSLVGYIAGLLKSTQGQLSVSLDSIAVLPTLQGKGIGNKLMECFINEVKRRGCKKITLAVAAVNKNGITFFTKQGFQKVRSLPEYYDKGVDGVLMKCTV